MELFKKLINSGASEKVLSAFKLILFLRKNELYKSIIDRFCESKYEIFITGGFIRDFLHSGKFSDDVDFVTNATPDEIRKLFYDRKFATGGQTFLVSFVDGVEIATYRKDAENTGNRSECKVVRARTLEEDLHRRDFTINAIAFSPIHGTFIDPLNGIADLKDQKINFIGNPEDRIYEDRERILRACRFVAVIDGSFGRSTLLALKEHSHLLTKVAPERICLETMKAMKVREASKFFNTMKLIGCLRYVFPSLENCFDKDGGPYHDETIYQHCMDVGDAIHPKYKLVKLAGYIHDIGKGPCAKIDPNDYKLKFIGHESVGSDLVKEELKALCFSNDDIKFIAGLVSAHMNSFNKAMAKRGIKRFLVRLEAVGVDYRSWLRLFIADKHGNRKSRDFTFGEIRSFLGKILYLYENENVFSLKELAINGNDVMDILDIGQGPRIGEILKSAFQHCLDFPENNNKEYLSEYIKTLEG